MKEFDKGDLILVGEFFWIDDKDLIGFDSNASHGDGGASGSVDEKCTLCVRGYEGGRLVVSLIRPEMPYGAQASIGTVFLINESTVLKWPGMRAKKRQLTEKRERLASKYCL